MPENVVEIPTTQPRETKPRSREKVITPQEREIKGVWEAIQFVDGFAKQRKRVIDEQTVKEIHQRVMRHFHPEVAGRYRDYEVGIKRAIFLPPHWSEVKTSMWQFGKDLEVKTSKLSTSLSGIEDAVRIGAWAHYEFVKTHPFADGNGRTARLLTDLIFKRVGLYYITDWGSQNEEYIDVLRRVDENNDLRHFVRFLARKLVYRFEEIEGKLGRGAISQYAKKSPLLVDLKNRRLELLRISKTQDFQPAIEGGIK